MKKVLKILLIIIASVLIIGFIENVLHLEIEPYYLFMIFVLVVSSLGYYSGNKKWVWIKKIHTFLYKLGIDQYGKDKSIED